jgi:Ca-activated chloride channel family protein
MRRTLYSILSILVIVSLFLTGCSVGKDIAALGKTVTVSIVYGSEKQEWLVPLVEEYNSARNRTADGSMIVVEAVAMGSIESIDAILNGKMQPVVWSPASSIYIPVANSEWRKTNADDLVGTGVKDLVLSPVVIAMWKPMAEALGYPEKPLGWEDIGKLAVSSEGWDVFGYPEWGRFQFGHTHPEFSNSGVVSVIAQFYAGAGKQRGLTPQDLQDPKVSEFVEQVQSSIIHYGTSTGFFGARMFERGPSYLSAAVLYENLIVAQEIKRINKESQQIPVVAIYPKEGTFWANHPYAVLNAPWVSAEQREAANHFQDFLLAQNQQERAIRYGFRPADPSIPLTAPLDAAHGVDPTQPKTVLEIPSAEVIRGTIEKWREIKKPVDLIVTIDTSGSMSGKKINSARQSVVQFIELLKDRDNLTVVTFNDESRILTPFSPLSTKRDEISRRVSGIVEGGDTALYDAVAESFELLQKEGDPKHIRAIVVLSDGQDTASTNDLNRVLELTAGRAEGGNAIKIFTIAYGDDADEEILKQIAESTGGRMYKSSPENIEKIYSEIATFF